MLSLPYESRIKASFLDIGAPRFKPVDLIELRRKHRPQVRPVGREVGQHRHDPFGWQARINVECDRWHRRVGLPMPIEFLHGRPLSPEELELIRRQVEEGFEVIAAVDGEIRGITPVSVVGWVVARDWPHLLAKLPPNARPKTRPPPTSPAASASFCSASPSLTNAAILATPVRPQGLECSAQRSESRR